MKSLLFASSFLLLMVSCSPLSTADRNAKRSQQKVLEPRVPFDSLQAKEQLAKGTSSIKGVLYKKTNKLAVVGGKTYGRAKKVELFPVTNYLMDWYNLRERHEGRNSVVYMSNEAYAYRLETYTDNYGRFRFDQLKPGKYFLQTFMTTVRSWTDDVVVGTNSYGTRFYEKQRFSSTRKHRIEKFVEVTKSREILEVKLK